MRVIHPDPKKRVSKKREAENARRVHQATLKLLRNLDRFEKWSRENAKKIMVKAKVNSRRVPKLNELVKNLEALKTKYDKRRHRFRKPTHDPKSQPKEKRPQASLLGIDVTPSPQEKALMQELCHWEKDSKNVRFKMDHRVWKGV